MNNPLNIRSYGWARGQLSWAYVVARLCKAFDDMGHNVYFASTNGLCDSDEYFTEDKMLESVIALQNFGPGKEAINLDWCYTVPINFPKRFLTNSKHKCVIYNYETSLWPNSWKQYYHLVDFYFPSSNFSAEIFYKNGIPQEKIFVIPHGVDTNIFNPNIPKIKLKTEKKFKFVSVVAPHYRKNIPLLLNAYCEAFTAKDDVCLILKTKSYKHSDGVYHIEKNPNGRKQFEIVLGDVFRDLIKKFGKKNIPSIELLSGHVGNVASILNACDCHVTTTGAEGFGLPMLESIACGLLNIVPNYSGHLDFLNEDNSLLIDVRIRKAKSVEQYWSANPKSTISECNKKHTIELMRKANKEYDTLMKKFKPSMDMMVKKFSWEYAAQRMIDATEGNIDPYIPGTYKL